jgi:hypothetical protein
MNTDSLFDSGYLPTVQPSRALASVRVDLLVDRLDSAEVTLAFLLRFLGLRVGPLQAIPLWMEFCAQACGAKHPQVADGLRAEAQIERLHQVVLLEDLHELFDLVGHARAQALLTDTNDPRIARHSAIRGLVPTRSEPLVVIGIDLELAQLGRELGPALLDVCRKQLGPNIDGCRFLRARTENAERRTPARVSCLAGVLRQYGPRGRDWAKVAADVTQSYLGAIEACAEPRHHSARVPLREPAWAC